MATERATERPGAEHRSSGSPAERFLPVALVGGGALDRLDVALQGLAVRTERWADPDDACTRILGGAEVTAVFATPDHFPALRRLLDVHGGDPAPVLLAAGSGLSRAPERSSSADGMIDLDHTCLQGVVALLREVHRLRVATRTQRARARALRLGVEQDLHTPLVAITHGLQRIPRGLLSASLRTDLDTLAAAARGILRRSTRLHLPGEGPPRPPRPQPFVVSVRPLVAEAALHAACGRSLLHFDPADGEPEVHLDPFLFRRCVEHLLANVRQHAIELLRLTVRVEDDRLVIEVVDRGPGLPGPAATRQVEQAGGGLAWCRTVVEAHGGELAYRVRPDGLTVRTVWPGVVGVLHTAPNGHLAHMRPDPLVWLADDDPEVRLSLARLLTHRKFRVEAFADGDALLVALVDADCVPEVVVVDAEMPGTPFLDVLVAVREVAPSVRRMIYTGYAPTPAVVEAFNQQLVNRFVRKGVPVEELAAALRALTRDDAGEPVEDRQRVAFEELLAHQRLTLHVQPIFSAITGRMVACEALLRSQHPVFRGPMEILEASRAYGREVALHRVLTRIAFDLVGQLPPDVDLFFNLDPVVLARPDQLDATFRALDPVAHRVVLELTERARLDEVSHWLDAVGRLRAKGYRMALDDVGAGYNSLGMVTAIRPDVLKLDISLVSGAPVDPAKQGLIRLLVQFAEGQEMITVAEGIEREDEAAMCHDLGVDRLQGFLLARPMPIEQALALFGAPVGQRLGPALALQTWPPPPPEPPVT